MSNIRFCQNNFLQVATTSAVASSAAAGFPLANAYDSYRYRAWRTGGNFDITTANQTIYINTGSNLSANIPAAAYASGALLAAAIQTALNSVSTLWVCTYSLATGKFFIDRSASPATLRLTQTTNAIWDTIGFTGVADVSVNPSGLTADVRRNHTSERVTIDLGAAIEVRAFHAIGGASEDFGISDTATVSLKGNNVPVFTAPPVDVSIVPERTGIFKYLEVADIANTTYRYWEFEFIDRENPNGPEFSLNQIYLGDYVSPATRNVNIGLQRTVVDQSRVFRSEGGVRYARRLPRYYRYSSTQVEFLIDSDRLELERVFETIGTTTPIFISYDPGALISNSVGEFTKYMTVESADVKHQLYKYHTIDFSAVEEI